MYYHQAQSGYSLVEVLVAIAILLLATVGPMTIAARSLQYAEFSSQQNTAYFLAQEGIEAVVKVREEAGIDEIENGGDSWAWVNTELQTCFIGNNPNGCGIDWRNPGNFNADIEDCSTIEDCRIFFSATAPRARYSHLASGDPTPYTRVIQLEEIAGSDQVRVRSEVRWNMHPSGDPQEVVLETYIHDIYDFIP